MDNIKGYKYQTEQETKSKIQECNIYYGIPVSSDSITQNYIDYYYSEFNNPPFYYIIFDESLIPILGQPSEFKIEIPN
jgi:hypothetical protein